MEKRKWLIQILGWLFPDFLEHLNIPLEITETNEQADQVNDQHKKDHAVTGKHIFDGSGKWNHVFSYSLFFKLELIKLVRELTQPYAVPKQGDKYYREGEQGEEHGDQHLRGHIKTALGGAGISTDNDWMDGAE
jgi:hypothetical protein